MTANQSILIVDDKQPNLVALERLLEKTGARVVRALNGNEALAASLHEPFALAILDVQMPEMDGFELASILRRSEPTRSLPIIFVSAIYTDPSHIFRGYGAGGVDFLIKPYEPAILLAKVEFFLLLDRQRRMLVDRAKIEESRNYLENILSSMTDAVLVTSADLRIQTANAAATALLKCPQKDLLGQSLTRFFTEGDFPKELNPRLIKSGDLNLRLDDILMTRANGETVPVILTAAFSEDERSAGPAAVFTAIDITERKKAEAERIQLEEQLRHAQRLESVGRLAGGVAHDFNNLLTVIFACCEFMTETLGDKDPLLQEVEDIMEASSRGADLVRQLLAFGHKQILRPEILEPNEIVQRTANMLSRTVGEHIEVRLRLTDESNLVSVDPVQLTQVLMNLGVNARDAMPDGGKLTFETSTRVASLTRDRGPSAENRVFQIRVGDTGCGIAPEVALRIFEPFYSTKSPGEGTGLGLSVVHGIVAQSGGHISVESQPGEGSTFIIDLPIREKASIETDANEESFWNHPSSGTILVVDDDEALQKVVVRSLTSKGYSVLQANSLSDALELARRSKVDLLLTDVVMPVHSGPTVASALLAETPEMAVIFMSGHAHDLLGHHGVETGHVSFIQKPFVPDTLLRLIPEVLAGNSKNRTHSP